MRIGLVALALAAAYMSTSASAEIRIASWNLNNLHHQLDEPLRPRAPARTGADLEILRKYRDRADADIFALQEVNGPRAAQLVFPADQWDLFFSGRYADDLITGRESDRIYTGFAVRRGVFDAVSKRDVAELSVRHTDGRPTRWGTEILVEKDGDLLRLLNVHLKSGCHGGSLEPATSPDCITLAAQRAPLEGWIDAAASAQAPFVIVGDWNRRIDVHGQNDHVWGEIDDADPLGLDLWRLPSTATAAATPASPSRSISSCSMTAPGSWSRRPRSRRSSTTRPTGMSSGGRLPTTARSSSCLTGRWLIDTDGLEGGPAEQKVGGDRQLLQPTGGWSSLSRIPAAATVQTKLLPA